MLGVACVGSADDAHEPAAGAELRATATIEELMRHVIDPAADAVWDAVVTEVSAQGRVDTRPETEEEWTALRHHAITLMEASDLLLVEGRPVAAEGSFSELPGVDLEPEQIEVLLERDPGSWRNFAGLLHEAGLEVRGAIDGRDVDALLVAGDRLDLACEVCHLRYWYPSLEGKPGTRSRDERAEPGG